MLLIHRKTKGGGRSHNKFSDGIYHAETFQERILTGQRVI